MVGGGFGGLSVTEALARGDVVSLNGLAAVSQPAMQEGKYVGRVTRARLEDSRSVAPFKVADAFWMKFTGPIGYLMWGFIHVLYLIGWGNRMITLYRWMRSLSFTHHRGERIITLEEAHHELTHTATHHDFTFNHLLQKRA